MKRYTIVFFVIIVLFSLTACSEDALKRTGERLSKLQNNVWGVKDNEAVENVKNISAEIVKDGRISCDSGEIELLVDALGEINSEKKREVISELLSQKAPEGVFASEVIGAKGNTDENTVWGLLAVTWKKAEKNKKIRDRIEKVLYFDEETLTLGDSCAVAVLFSLAEHINDIVEEDKDVEASDVVKDDFIFDAYAALKVIDFEKYDCSELLSDYVNEKM